MLLGRRSVLLAFGAIATAACTPPRRPPLPPPATPIPPEPEPLAATTASVSAVPAPVEPPPEQPAPEPEAPAANDALALDLPARKKNAETGSKFLERCKDLPRIEFEEAVYQAIASGNVPRFERKFVPVEIREGSHVAMIFVLPDYLAIGSDDDFELIPMAPRTAQRVARLTGTTLPTKKLVDDIYGAAIHKLRPRYIDGGPNPDLDNHDDYVTHKQMLDEQRSLKKVVLGQLTAGDKKDIVLTNKLVNKPGRVAIYGWHREAGRPIQPLATVHAGIYADYSHGVRLVRRAMVCDGRARGIDEMMKSPRLCAMVSDEGPLQVLEYPV